MQAADYQRLHVLKVLMGPCAGLNDVLILMPVIQESDDILLFGHTQLLSYRGFFDIDC